MKKKVIIFITNLFDSILDLILDRFYAIETRKCLPVTSMDVNSVSIKHGRRYQPVTYRLFNKIFKELDYDWSNYNFIDIGSGKGRAIFMATNYGFKSIIGLEYAKNLCEDCQKNLNNFKKYNKKIHSQIEIVNQDALVFTPSKGPNVFFMYNPFDGSILRKFLNNLIEKNAIGSNDLFVYVNPIREFVFHTLRFDCIHIIDNIDHNRVTKIFRYHWANNS